LKLNKPINNLDKRTPVFQIENNDFYLCESDLYMGDIVLNFPNPDAMKNESVTFE
jgi:hypothetical protein